MFSRKSKNRNLKLRALSTGLALFLPLSLLLSACFNFSDSADPPDSSTSLKSEAAESTAESMTGTSLSADAPQTSQSQVSSASETGTAPAFSSSENLSEISSETSAGTEAEISSETTAKTPAETSAAISTAPPTVSPETSRALPTPAPETAASETAASETAASESLPSASAPEQTENEAASESETEDRTQETTEAEGETVDASETAPSQTAAATAEQTEPASTSETEPSPGTEATSASETNLPPLYEQSVGFSIDIRELLENKDKIKNPGILNLLDESGYIYRSDAVKLEQNDTVLGLLERIAQKNNIQIDVESTFLGKYVSGILYIYEKDAGPNSGWVYEINGRQPQMSADKYVPENGDQIVWRYVITY